MHRRRCLRELVILGLWRADKAAAGSQHIPDYQISWHRSVTSLHVGPTEARVPGRGESWLQGVPHYYGLPVISSQPKTLKSKILQASSAWTPCLAWQSSGTPQRTTPWSPRTSLWALNTRPGGAAQLAPAVRCTSGQPRSTSGLRGSRAVRCVPASARAAATPWQCCGQTSQQGGMQRAMATCSPSRSWCPPARRPCGCVTSTSPPSPGLLLYGPAPGWTGPQGAQSVPKRPGSYVSVSACAAACCFLLPLHPRNKPATLRPSNKSDASGLQKRMRSLGSVLALHPSISSTYRALCTAAKGRLLPSQLCKPGCIHAVACLPLVCLQRMH